MQLEGPALALLLRRLIDTPPEFLAEPTVQFQGGDRLHLPALLHDVAADWGMPLDGRTLSALGWGSAPGEWLRLCAISCWLLAEPALRCGEWPVQAQGPDAAGPLSFFVRSLAELVQGQRAAVFVEHPDRREELVRLVLMACGLRPAGETVSQAQDALTAVSGSALRRLLADARRTEARAREVREALARKAAQEAADKYTRE